MTREEIDKIASDYLNDCESESDMLEVFALAKEALEKEPCDDCVSREEAIKAIDSVLFLAEYSFYLLFGNKCTEALKLLPSVQPKREKGDEEIIKETVASIWGKPPYEGKKTAWKLVPIKKGRK